MRGIRERGCRENSYNQISNNYNQTKKRIRNNSYILNTTTLKSLVGALSRWVGIRVSKLRRVKYNHINNLNGNITHYKVKISKKRALISRLFMLNSFIFPDCSIGLFVGVWLSSKEKFKLLVFRIYEYIRLFIFRLRFISFVRRCKRL